MAVPEFISPEEKRLQAAGAQRLLEQQSGRSSNSLHVITSSSRVHSVPLSGPAPYPKPIGGAGYYGITGQFVKLVEPHTEADPNFLLVSYLLYAGNCLGREAFVWAGGDRHYPNLFACGVGPTSNARKGSARGPVEMFFRGIDDDWLGRILTGLSTGEGLIAHVRDPRYEIQQPKGKSSQPERVLADEGVPDKRLVVAISEFYSVLQLMRRQGNTLSAIVREAWDRGELSSPSKNSPVRATNAHISIIGNITRDELLRGVLAEEADNGFANRFLWVCSKRSKVLPEGGRMAEVENSRELQQLRVKFNQVHGTVKGAISRDADANDIWGYNDNPSAGVYSRLTQERPGLFGMCTGRAAPHVLRLSLIYALLDSATEIRREHLDAALEVWRYCDESAAYIFGQPLDPSAERILQALRLNPHGLTRTEITKLFDGHKKSEDLDTLLSGLQAASLARPETQRSGGRPTERWLACPGV